MKRNILKMLIPAIFIITSQQAGLAQMEHKMTAGQTKIDSGIKATLKVSPAQSMVDLLLTDAKTGKEITKAKVFAEIKGPDGRVQKKELLGMKMGEEFSFMNTLDLSLKGSYSFKITVETERNIKFNFVYEVK